MSRFIYNESFDDMSPKQFYELKNPIQVNSSSECKIIENGISLNCKSFSVCARISINYLISVNAKKFTIRIINGSKKYRNTFCGVKDDDFQIYYVTFLINELVDNLRIEVKHDGNDKCNAKLKTYLIIYSYN